MKSLTETPYTTIKYIIRNFREQRQLSVFIGENKTKTIT